MSPTINGATLANAYNAGLAPDHAADERSAAANGASPQRAAASPDQRTVAAMAADHALAADPRDTATFNLETLAAAVGLDPDELLNQVKSGQGVSDLLGRTGDAGYGSTVRDSVRGGIVFDEYV